MGWGAPLVEGFVRQSQKQGGAESQALSKTPPSSSRSADPASPQPPAHLALPWGSLADSLADHVLSSPHDPSLAGCCS